MKTAGQIYERKQIFLETIVTLFLDLICFGFLAWTGQLWAVILFALFAVIYQERMVKSLVRKVYPPR